MRPYSRSLERQLGRRWGMRAIDRLRGMADLVVPTAQVDRGWGDDEVNVWGYTAEIGTTASPTEYPTVVLSAGGLVAAETDRDLYVRRLDFRLGAAGQFNLLDLQVHVARVFPSYDPTPLSAGEWFPALFPGVAGATVVLPDCRVTTGLATSLQSATVGGVPISPLLGPRYVAQRELASSFPPPTVNFFDPIYTTILDWQDPPLLVPAGQRVMIQHYNPGGAGRVLTVSAWVSEREQPRR